MNLIAFLLLIPAIACYTVSQLAQHGKIRWPSKEIGFWGIKSDLRKYKNIASTPDLLFFPVNAPNTWYYRFFKIKYKERFPLSAKALVFLTDGYHFMQFLFFLFLSVSVTFAAGFTWILFLLVWLLVHIIHFLVYKLLQK